MLVHRTFKLLGDAIAPAKLTKDQRMLLLAALGELRISVNENRPRIEEKYPGLLEAIERLDNEAVEIYPEGFTKTTGANA